MRGPCGRWLSTEGVRTLPRLGSPPPAGWGGRGAREVSGVSPRVTLGPCAGRRLLCTVGLCLCSCHQASFPRLCLSSIPTSRPREGGPGPCGEDGVVRCRQWWAGLGFCGSEVWGGSLLPPAPRGAVWSPGHPDAVKVQDGTSFLWILARGARGRKRTRSLTLSVPPAAVTSCLHQGRITEAVHEDLDPPTHMLLRGSKREGSREQVGAALGVTAQGPLLGGEGRRPLPGSEAGMGVEGGRRGLLRPCSLRGALQASTCFPNTSVEGMLAPAL